MPEGSTVFGGAAERARAPASPLESAPRRPYPPPRAMPAADTTPIGRRVHQLRRAALFDLFDRVGLDVIPGQIWFFIDERGDLAEGVEQFLRALGLDVDKVRRRDRGEVARANEALELLATIGSAFDRLPAEALAELHFRVFSGDYDSVREALAIVAACERIVRIASRWEGERQLALFSSFLAEVRSALDDPLSLTSEEALQAEALAVELGRLMADFDHLIREQSRIVAEIAHVWPAGWQTGPEADELSELVSTFENTIRLLETEDWHEVPTVRDVLTQLGESNERLESLMRRAHRARSAGGAGARGGGRDGRDGAGDGGAAGSGGKSGPGAGRTPTEREEALIFFGFDPADSPARKAVQKRWHAFLKNHFPDHASDEADRKLRNDRCALANRHKDYLFSVL